MSETQPISDASRREALPDNAPHVLVVDDDHRIRDLLTRYLTDKGYRITPASDAAAARAI